MDKSTFALAEEFISHARECERTLTATWWRNPIRWGRRILGIWSFGDSKAAEMLAVRYEGMLWQLFRRAGINEGKLKEYMIAVWQDVAAKARTLSDSKLFSKILWDVVFYRCSNPSLLSLKPKLMLRQFVDEMELSDERGVLRAIAYGEPRQFPTNRELLDLLTRSYTQLHVVLWRYIGQVDALSDGAISGEMIRRLIAPYLEYEALLFDKAANVRAHGRLIIEDKEQDKN